jgi:hypothetical protein
VEIHLVHWNTGYGNPTEAKAKRDGLGVVGLLFEADESGSGARAVRKHPEAHS